MTKAKIIWMSEVYLENIGELQINIDDNYIFSIDSSDYWEYNYYYNYFYSKKGETKYHYFKTKTNLLEKILNIPEIKNFKK
ncbi:hypothetical protein [Anaerosphaera multitolerans]|uniref:Uncharacterized protein n=1 Tax=Anaerosphaera multitolerans TaxID=2487351 RepID=A0A437S8U0_9FIRM|nr:hypothetical protein [Anaerosphaera multitolerans]RVU55513.1 hypothetical protein EF514_01950 [Anaerosphaera multitolerans]